jgi:hypothetical protein
MCMERLEAPRRGNVWWSVGRAPQILKFGTRWWTISFMLRSLCSRGNNEWHSLHRRLSGPPSQSERCEGRKKNSALAKNRTRSPGSPDRSLVITPSRKIILRKSHISREACICIQRKFANIFLFIYGLCNNAITASDYRIERRCYKVLMYLKTNCLVYINTFFTVITIFVNCIPYKRLRGHLNNSEKYSLLIYDGMQLSRSSLMFRRNVLPPSSGLKSTSATTIYKFCLLAVYLAVRPLPDYMWAHHLQQWLFMAIDEGTWTVHFKEVS